MPNKILIVLGALQLGGAERQALLLADQLRHQSGIAVEIAGPLPAAGVMEFCQERGISCCAFRRPWNKSASLLSNFRTLLAFLFFLRHRRPNVIISYTFMPNVLCALFWRLTGCSRFIWNQRDPGLGLSRILRIFLFRHTVSFFVSNSEEGRQAVISALGVAPDKIALIANGVLLPVSDQPLPVLPPADFYACMLANIQPLKDHETAVRAWKMVCERTSSKNVLVLAGHRQESAALEQLIADLELQDRVFFAGSVQNIAGLLKRMQLGVFCSFREGVPNGVLECMAAGLPIVATDLPGIRQALPPENHFCLVPPRSPEAVAEQLLQLMSSESLRCRVGAANREQIENCFSVEKMVQRYLQVIDLPRGYGTCTAGKELRIAILTDRLVTGGGCRYIQQLASCMPDNTFIVFARDGVLPALEKLPNVKIVTGKITWRKVLAEHCDLIHTNHLKALLALLCNPFVKRDIPLVHTVHGVHLRKYGFRKGGRAAVSYGLRKALECWLYRKCSALISLTVSDRNYLMEEMAVKVPIHVIPNGIDTSGRVAGSDVSGEMCMIGRFDFAKGQDILVRAIAEQQEELRRRGRKIKFIGDGPLRAKIHTLIAESRVEDLIEECGEIVDAGIMLSPGSIVIMPSRWEGLPFLLLEAGIRKALVIASDVCGIRDCIEDGECGLLFPCEDSHTLGKLLIREYSDSEISRYGNALCRRVCENFSQNNMISRTRALYSEILRQG